MDSGRDDEAHARFDVALAASREVGDKGLEGTTLQRQGGLAANRGQVDRASRLYQQALQSFQEAGNLVAMMLTYNLLGVAERKAGRLAEARAWYQKSRELAEQLRDRAGLGQAARNIGIVFRQGGDDARKRGDEPAAQRHFEEARRHVEESLRIEQARGSKPKEALSRSVLADIFLRLGDLAVAECYANEARQINESLGLKEALGDYNTLVEIAQARGDAAAAAEWAKKRDDLLEELERRAGGGGVPAKMMKAFQALAVACAQAGLGGDALGSAEEETVAQIDQLPAPFPDFAAFLRQVAAGQLPAVPASLPAELRQLSEGLVQAIKEARGSAGSA